MKYSLRIYNHMVAICHAIDSQNLTILKNLLARKVNVNCLATPRDKYDGVFYESFNSYNRVFIDGVSPFEIPLERAVKTQNIEIINVILNAGQNLHNWDDCIAAGLETAIDLRNMEIITLLFSKGADPSKAYTENVPIINAVLDVLLKDYMMTSKVLNINHSSEANSQPKNRSETPAP